MKREEPRNDAASSRARAGGTLAIFVINRYAVVGRDYPAVVGRDYPLATGNWIANKPLVVGFP